MAKEVKVTQEQTEVKKPQVAREVKGSCGCGCMPPMKK